MADTGMATLTFVREKDTKNTVRYAESTPPGQAPVVGTLYVQKSWLASTSPPERLLVTIKPSHE